MNTQEKSLKLAELMPEWVIENEDEGVYVLIDHNHDGSPLCPYSNSSNGLWQFAAVLLKFPEVIDKYHMISPESGLSKRIEWYRTGVCEEHPTQANILDEILRMNGVEI